MFATISGAHLYGFPSPDSDFDLRGAHVLPLENVVSLEVREETIEQSFVVPADTSSGLRPPSPQSGEAAGALEMDIVSHDVRKFFRLLLKKHGYVLEQLYSPLIVHTTPEHAELKAICNPKQGDTSLCPLPDRGGEGKGSGVITKHNSHHYFGFAETQWKLFLKTSPRRVKPLLYVYRVLLTGIHLMRTGEVEANLVTLNEEFRLPYIADLVARKLAGRLAVEHPKARFVIISKDSGTSSGEWRRNRHGFKVTTASLGKSIPSLLCHGGGIQYHAPP